MTINEAITAVLTASHHGDQHFRKFLLGDDPEVVAMRKALVQLADAVRDADWPTEFDYPSPEQYSGGGTILNRNTSINNLEGTALREGLSFSQLLNLICGGNEVVVCHGKIQSVGTY